MSIKKLSITKEIIENIVESFDDEPTGGFENEDGSMTLEYGKCEYWLEDADIANSGISAGVECYIKYRAKWRGFDNGKDEGVLTIFLNNGDEIPVIYPFEADYSENESQ